MSATLIDIACDELMPDPTQPRKTFIAAEIEKLAASIAARGLLQPVRVMWDSARQCYVIITGESRWRAAKHAGWTHIQCIVIDGNPDEAALLADRIVENTCRQDLLPLALSRALAKLKALKKCTSQALASELGISAAALTRAEALLSLPEDIQEMVDDGRVPESIGYELSRMPGADAQRELAAAVCQKRLKRDAVAEAVRAKIGKRAVKPRAGRLVCRLAGGVSVSISASDALDWTTLIEAIDRIRREARKLCDSGKDVAALAKSLHSS